MPAKRFALVIVMFWCSGAANAAPPARPPTSPGEAGLEAPSQDDSEQGEQPVPDGLPPPPPTQPVEEVPADEDQPLILSEEELLEQKQIEFEQHVQVADAALRAGNYDLAVREYSNANDLQPGDPNVLLGRAQARLARVGGDRCPRGAINDLLLLATYDPRGLWLEQRGRVIEWMGRCDNDYASERLALARELAAERPGAPGRPDDILVTVARLEYARVRRSKSKSDKDDGRSAALEVLERYREEIRAAGEKPALDALELQGRLNRELDRLDQAIEVYTKLQQAYPQEPEARDAGEWLQELRDEKTLREWERSQGGKPTPEAEAAYRAGARALRQGDLATAEAHLTAARESSPWYAKANYALGVVQARTGRFEEAVESLEKAVLADRSDYQARVKLGLIYKQEFGGTRDDDARRHLETALRLRPDLHILHLHLGELYARTDREIARTHYQRFLDKAPGDPAAKRARQALDELDRTIREDEPLTVPPPPKESLRYLEPELQRMINEAYLKGTEQQNWERAEQILRDARERYPDEPVVVNELAKVMYAQNRTGDARTFWEQSLKMDEDQRYVHEQLGLLLEEDLPEEALPHLRRAAEASPMARYHLANLLWTQGDLLEGSRQLDRYLVEADKHDLYWARANELRGEMDQVFLYGGLGLGFVLLVLIGIPGWRVYRRLRGASLAQLLARHPKSFPEVARILSLIRHEILKHNTAFLADVGRALTYDTEDANHRALILSRRMFGQQPPKKVRGRRRRRSPGTGGIYDRFLGYVEELEQVARGHGVRLNLYRKDPTFRPMLEAFEDLAKRAHDLRNPGALGHRRRSDLARTLRRSGNVLGRQAFERLSGLIHSLCVVDVDRAFLQRVYERVLEEEQFRGVALAPLELAGTGARIRVFQTDLEDILANVLRNSLRSSVQYAKPPVGLGIELHTETDEITGLGSLAIRIKDRSPEPLSNEMLRGRYVERGMGITVDLLSRYDGSIGVEAEQGWEKAVVLRFFTLEERGVDASSSASMSMRAAS